MNPKIELLDAPSDPYALRFFVGYLGSVLDRKRRVSPRDWNRAVARAEAEYGSGA